MTNTTTMNVCENTEHFMEGGKFDFIEVLGWAMQTPGVKIDRASFLRKELGRHFEDDVVEEAIRLNPARAGIVRADIDEIVDCVIAYENAKVSTMSFLTFITGEMTAVGASTGDIISYCVFSVRVVQKLAYLYGFQEINLEEDTLDSETMQAIILFLGTMFGVQEAAKLMTQYAEMYARNYVKKLARKSLTKGFIYPIVKEICKEIGIKMTKQIFADTIASAIPIVNGLASGCLTYLAFGQSCTRLQGALKKNRLCNNDW